MFIIKAKGTFTMKKSGVSTFTKGSNSLSRREKIGLMCPHNCSHVLAKMSSLNQSVLEKTLANVLKGILQKLPFKNVYIRKDKKDGWTAEDERRLRNIWQSVLGLWLDIGLGGIAIKDKWVNFNMDRTLCNCILSVVNFLSAPALGIHTLGVFSGTTCWGI